MNPAPPGWSRLSSAVVYRDAAAAIDWLCKAFGFVVRIKVEGAGGRIEHCELVFGDGVIMLAEERPNAAGWRDLLRAPGSAGGANTQTLMIYVDDAAAHCEQARTHGARILEEPQVHDYGEDHWSDLSYGAMDPEGHVWWIAQRLRSAPQPPTG